MIKVKRNDEAMNMGMGAMVQGKLNQISKMRRVNTENLVGSRRQSMPNVT
ncbi:MAG TPA: hypothetical protein VFL85_04035 [Candidatus Saccharimonadales bacterium]|nr:hypothetical protein [Candidatus Saccharimonadales bacterium]